MNEELFRKSSVEYVTSKERLDEYIKVTNPGAWLTVTGIFLLLVCAVIFSGASNFKTAVPVSGVVEGKKIHVFVSPGQAEEMAEGMAFEKNQQKLGEILEIGEEPVRRELTGSGYLSEYYRDVKLEKWNVEVVISNDRGLAEGEEIDGSVVTKESKILELIVGDTENHASIEKIKSRMQVLLLEVSRRIED